MHEVNPATHERLSPPTLSSSERFAEFSAHASDVPSNHEQGVWAVSPDTAPFSSASSPYAPYASHVPSDPTIPFGPCLHQTGLLTLLRLCCPSKVLIYLVAWSLSTTRPSPLRFSPTAAPPLRLLGALPRWIRVLPNSSLALAPGLP